MYILKNIMDRLNHERNKDGLPSVKPCEVFDLIGGTSTGGLIAVMLGRLEMSVDDCISAYTDLAAAVFGEKISRFPFGRNLQVKSRFDSAKLKTAIEKVVTGSGSSADDMFVCKTRSKCKTFVCAVDLHTKDIVRLRSYTLPDESNIPATICQAGLATSAASTFFDPVSIGNRLFADGALGANNPVDEVEGEAANIWCSDTGDLKPFVKCFVSIGTGNPGKTPFEDKVHKFLAETVVQIATDTEATEKRFMNRWAKHFDEKRYFRFNVEQGLQNIGLDEYNKQGPIEAVTESYLSHREQKFRVRDCVRSLLVLQLKRKRAGADISILIAERRLRPRIDDHHSPQTNGLWVCPFQRNEDFVDRAAEINQLQEKLSSETRCARVAICGLGGVGKTQIALEFAHRWREQHPNGSMFWIPVTDVSRMQEAYLQIGRRLQISGLDHENADIPKLVQQRLSQESSRKWLLIFDNADDIEIWTEEVETANGRARRLDQLPKSKHGSILFTTRSRKAATKLAGKSVIFVEEMDDAIAKDLLKGSLFNEDLVLDDCAATDLVQKLTYLPLAIVQAAAYINANDITLAEYARLLDDVEQNVIDLLSEDFEDEGRYRDIRNPVAITFVTSFEQIRTRDSLAAEYLSLMACIDARDIPQSLLPPTESEKRAVEAIGTLSAYSFIKKHGTDQLLDIHRLIQLATRNWLRTYDSLDNSISKALERLHDVLPSRPYLDYGNRQMWGIYMPHTRQAIELQRKSQTIPVNIDLLWKFSYCLESDRRFNEATEIIKQLFKAQTDTYGLEDQETLQALSNLALSYEWQRKWDQAEPLHVQALELRKKVLGTEHPDTLKSMGRLSSVYMNQLQLDESEQLCLQTLEMKKNVLGSEHPDTLKSMGHLLRIYRKQGRLDEAERLGEETLEKRKKVLGAEHPDTLSSMRDLSWIYLKQGRLDEAGRLGEETLEKRKKVLGAEHPDTLSSIGDLSRIYLKQGRLDEAERLGEETLEKRKKVLGAEHPDILSSIGDLSWIYLKQGRLDESARLGQQYMELQVKTLGTDHPGTLKAINQMSIIYREQGRLQEAQQLGLQAVEIGKTILGTEHLDTTHYMFDLAQICGNLGKWNKAEELEMRALEVYTKLLGKDAKLTLDCMYNLSITWREMGRQPEARKLLEECIEHETQLRGAENSQVLESIVKLAAWEAEDSETLFRPPANRMEVSDYVEETKAPQPSSS
jgi:tetratricopeptide (TPR) repeat protein/predicted acylesterase/phospholipase RssA